MTQLVDGCIPANTPCPFRDRCEVAQGNVCRHQGEHHDCAFSCAIARAFDMQTGFARGLSESAAHESLEREVQHGRS